MSWEKRCQVACCSPKQCVLLSVSWRKEGNGLFPDYLRVLLEGHLTRKKIVPFIPRCCWNPWMKKTAKFMVMVI